MTKEQVRVWPEGPSSRGSGHGGCGAWTPPTRTPQSPTQSSVWLRNENTRGCQLPIRVNS